MPSVTTSDRTPSSRNCTTPEPYAPPTKCPDAPSRAAQTPASYYRLPREQFEARLWVQRYLNAAGVPYPRPPPPRPPSDISGPDLLLAAAEFNQQQARRDNEIRQVQHIIQALALQATRGPAGRRPGALFELNMLCSVYDVLILQGM